MTGNEAKFPPIDAEAGVIGRTAPVKHAAPIADDSTHLHGGSLSNGAAHFKPKGCGREDCCQISSTNAKQTKKHLFFPRFELKPYKPRTELIFPNGLKKYEMKPLMFGNTSRQWLRPTNLEQLVQLLGAYPDAKLVGGSSEIQIEVKVWLHIFLIIM